MSNGIGQFTIGVSSIGGQSSFDPLRTVISQYANSPTLLQLIDNFWTYVDQSANLDAFFDLVWNVDTAQGWGLDVWGRIVGVSRVLQVAVGNYFGFEEGDGSPFNTDSFYTGDPTTGNYALIDQAFRVLILAKALANISDGSIPGINQILINLFPGRGNCYVTDGPGKAMTYTFEFTLTPVEFAIVATSGVLPRPSGTPATVVQM